MSNVEKQRILVVDDDPTISEVVARYLEREGYDVDIASDGEEALALGKSGSRFSFSLPR